MKDLIQKELNQRLNKEKISNFDAVAKDIEEKERELVRLRETAVRCKETKEKHYLIVERNFTGVGATIRKQGENVSISVNEGYDIMALFQSSTEADPDIGDLESFQDKVKKQAFSLSENDFVLDCIISRDDRGIFLYVCDMPFFKEDLTKMQLYKRKELVSKLNFSDIIKESPYVIARNSMDVRKAIELFKQFDDREGAIFKRYTSVYKLGEQKDDWFIYKG